MPIVRWEDVVSSMTNLPDGVRNRSVLNVSTSNYNTPKDYTLMNAVILYKMGTDQHIFLGEWSWIGKNNLESIIREIGEKTTLVMRDRQNREYLLDGKGEVTVVPLPYIRKDVLQYFRDVFENPFVWKEGDRLVKGKEPPGPSYPNGILSNAWCLLILVKKDLFPEMYEKVDGVVYGTGSSINYQKTLVNMAGNILEKPDRKVHLQIIPEFGVGNVEVLYKGKKIDYLRGRVNILDLAEKSENLKIEIRIKGFYTPKNVSKSSLEKLVKKTRPIYQRIVME